MRLGMLFVCLLTAGCIDFEPNRQQGARLREASPSFFGPSPLPGPTQPAAPRPCRTALAEDVQCP